MSALGQSGHHKTFNPCPLTPKASIGHLQTVLSVIEQPGAFTIER
jgi:hypothetical protein